MGGVGRRAGPDNARGPVGGRRLGRIPLPDHVTTPEQAEAYACEFAKQKRWQLCLSLSRRHAVWVNEEGRVYFRSEATPDHPNGPWMALGKHGKRFLPRMRIEKPNE